VFVVLSHLYASGGIPGQIDSELDIKWQHFSKRYGIEQFGRDGYFVRAIRNGHGLINKTYDYAWRFTRKKRGDKNNSCANCHSPEDLAFSFVKSDRYDSKAGKRLSFEDKIMRCYVKNMDGFVPTIFDPAIRDIRIYARMVAHHYKLVDGSIRPPPVANIVQKNEANQAKPVKEPSIVKDKIAEKKVRIKVRYRKKHSKRSRRITRRKRNRKTRHKARRKTKRKARHRAKRKIRRKKNKKARI